MFVDDLAEDFSLPILEDFDPPMVARVLGHALYLLPGEGCDALTREILDCQGPDEPELLAGLAHLYAYGLIRVCKCTERFVVLFALKITLFSA